MKSYKLRLEGTNVFICQDINIDAESKEEAIKLAWERAHDSDWVYEIGTTTTRVLEEKDELNNYKFLVYDEVNLEYLGDNNTSIGVSEFTDMPELREGVDWFSSYDKATEYVNSRINPGTLFATLYDMKTRFLIMSDAQIPTARSYSSFSAGTVGERITE